MTSPLERRWAGFRLDRPLVMGILNVTPDSFSNGGLFFDSKAAIAAGCAMRAAGADIIDVGGESTRPGAAIVEPSDEIQRILPVVRGLAETGAVISVDTRNAVTMSEALDCGAIIVNDVSGLQHDPAAAKIVAARQCGVILMHMRGTPETMDQHTHYTDLVSEVSSELLRRRDAALAAGIANEAIVLDPGFGFSKIGVQNVNLLKDIERFVALGHPVLVGVSRKRFIGELVDEYMASRRDVASIAAGLFAASRGATILRVHDVPGTVQALRVWRALAAI